MTVRESLEAIYRDERRQLLACACAVLVERSAAEDALHSAFVKLLRLRRAPRDWRTYVYRSVRNEAIDGLRKRQRTREGSLESPGVNHVAAPQYSAGDRIDLKAALERLALDTREVIVLKTQSLLTFREIGRILDLPAATAATRYRRGLEQLKQTLEPSHGSSERDRPTTERAGSPSAERHAG